MNNFSIPVRRSRALDAITAREPHVLRASAVCVVEAGKRRVAIIFTDALGETVGGMLVSRRSPWASLPADSEVHVWGDPAIDGPLVAIAPASAPTARETRSRVPQLVVNLMLKQLLDTVLVEPVAA